MESSDGFTILADCLLFAMRVENGTAAVSAMRFHFTMLAESFTTTFTV
jgi:hypothetical protein